MVWEGHPPTNICLARKIIIIVLIPSLSQWRILGFYLARWCCRNLKTKSYWLQHDQEAKIWARFIWVNLNTANSDWYSIYWKLWKLICNIPRSIGWPWIQEYMAIYPKSIWHWYMPGLEWTISPRLERVFQQLQTLTSAILIEIVRICHTLISERLINKHAMLRFFIGIKVVIII